MRAVWIVDDDDEMSHAVKLMLQLLDSTVEIFRDARSAAKRLLAGDRPELIVLDINMPEVSGIDFLPAGVNSAGHQHAGGQRNRFFGIPAYA